MGNLINGDRSLIDQLIEALKQNTELRKEVETLKSRLEVSRSLQPKPKLFPPAEDPYYGETDGA